MKLKNLFTFAIVLFIISSAMVWTFKQGGIITLQQQAIKQIVPRPDLSFSEVVISEIAGPIRHWEIKAEQAVVEKKQAKLLKVKGVIYQKNRAMISFISPQVFADLERSRFDMQKVTANSIEPKDDPWRLRAGTLSWNSSLSQLLGKKDVVVWNQRSQFQGDIFEGNVDFQRFSLKDNARAALWTVSENVTTPQVKITCTQISYLADKNIISASQNVKAYYTDLLLYGDSLIYYATVKDLTLLGHVLITYTSKDGIPAIISSESASYNASIREAHFKDRVGLKYADIICQADEAIFYQDKEYIELMGRVKAQDKEQKLSGDKLSVFLATKKIVVQGRTKFVAPK